MAAFTAIAIAALVAEVYGQVRAGQAAKKAGTAQKEASGSLAELSDYNASVAELQAKDATQRGAEQEARFRSQVKGIIGTQRAGIAAGNIDVGFGSAVDVQADAAFLGELDALTIRNNATREAWGYRVQAEDLRKRAEIARKTGVYQEGAGRQAATSSYFNAAATLAGGTASLLQQRYAMRNG